MSAPAQPGWRILVGAETFADARAALRLVERLGLPRISELGGLFVEDSSVAAAAALPMQRVVTAAGTLKRVHSAGEMGARIERDAAAFRELLARVARQRKWSFERRRGAALPAGLQEIAARWDVLLLGHQLMCRFGGEIVLIAPPDAAPPPRAAGLAADLSRALGVGVHSLTVAPPGSAAGAGRLDVECLASEAALITRLSRLPAAAVVADLAAGPLSGFDALGRLLDAARCPAIILGAGGTDTGGTDTGRNNTGGTDTGGTDTGGPAAPRADEAGR